MTTLTTANLKNLTSWQLCLQNLLKLSDRDVPSFNETKDVSDLYHQLKTWLYANKFGAVTLGNFTLHLFTPYVGMKLIVTFANDNGIVNHRVVQVQRTAQHATGLVTLFDPQPDFEADDYLIGAAVFPLDPSAAFHCATTDDSRNNKLVDGLGSMALELLSEQHKVSQNKIEPIEGIYDATRTG